MKRKIKFKLPFFILLLIIIPVLFLVTEKTVNQKEKVKKEPENNIKISYPVINETNKIINPYSDESVKIGKRYYDYKAEEQIQEDSLTVHDNIYYQNTGIDFTSEEEFDVLSISNGTVVNVKEDQSTGKTVEIKHDNGLISIYQSLSDVRVKKDDIVSQAQIIGRSGTNELDKELGNHLHLEIYENGISVNPEMYLGKPYEKKN